MAVAAIMGTMSPKAAGVREADSAGQVSSRDTNTMPWEIRHIDELDGDLAAKQLIEDLDTGMSVMKMKYFAGFTNEWHTHPCAHGMYVLDGVLKTHAGSLGSWQLRVVPRRDGNGAVTPARPPEPAG
jgi:hypothetical protein